MPRSYRSLALASASNRRSDEDRLTEIYAVAIEAHAGFASEIFKLAGLPVADAYEAHTQRQFREVAGRLDLYVVGRNGKRQTVAILYAEHKEPGGRASQGQRDKYLPALKCEIRSQGVDGRLLWIVGRGDDPDGRIRERKPENVAVRLGRVRRNLEQEASRRPPERVDRTWQDIANCAELAGRDSAAPSRRSTWREDAERPSAPASQRILRELLWYLEEKGYAVAKGMTETQLTEAVNALEIVDTLDALLALAIEKLDRRKVGRFTVARSRSGYLNLSPDTSWIDTWSGRLELNYDAGDATGRLADQQLTWWLAVGLSRAHARTLSERSAFRSQLDDHHLGFDFEEHFFIGASIPLRKLIVADGSQTLDDQADALASWAQERLAVLLKLKPGRKPALRSSRS